MAALRDALRTRGLQAILLKGGALIETVYGVHLGLRPLSDLDLLLRPEAVASVAEILCGRGFRPTSATSLLFDRGSFAFDLHTELVGAAWFRRKEMAFRYDGEDLWREASPLDPHDPSLLLLEPSHQFLHLILHALKHSFNRLIWFIDLGLVLKQVRWAGVVNRAEAAGALRVLAYALLPLRAIMGIEVPEAVVARLPRLNRAERAFLDRVVTRRPMETPGDVVVAFSIPGLQGKLGYLLELAFPRREVLVRHYPSTPAWLLYPHRVIRLVPLGWREGRAFFRG